MKTFITVSEETVILNKKIYIIYKHKNIFNKVKNGKINENKLHINKIHIMIK